MFACELIIIQLSAVSFKVCHALTLDFMASIKDDFQTSTCESS